MEQAPPHLSGNYAPVTEEITACELTTEGSIPPELTGWYLRNGPNPYDAASGHWFFGDGMVHGVRLENGRATSYRNRWVRTATFLDDRRPTRENVDQGLAGGRANTHVVRHAGHILALVETSLPYKLEPGLDTIGPYDFNGQLNTAMTAHPKVCPETGEMHFFGYRAGPAPYLTYHRTDAAGNLVVSRAVDEAGPTMMHDFALTARHVIFMDLPIVFDLGLAQRGGTMPYRWDDGYGARLGLLRRDDPGGVVRWFDIEPCYVFHTLNAHEAGDQVVLTAVRYPELWRHDNQQFDQSGMLWQWTIDLVEGTVTEQQLDDRTCEFPRIDDRLAGLDAGYGQTIASPGEAGPLDVGVLLRYDLHSGSVAEHRFGPGRHPSEAAFAPADDQPGGAGWLMSYVYDASSDTSDLVILDAADLAAPVATIHLPRRVPFGFHGNWLPDPLAPAVL
jgi:carotenoid cleavage dioxygenase-like enzyme